MYCDACKYDAMRDEANRENEEWDRAQVERKAARLANIETHLNNMGVNARKYGRSTLANFDASDDPHALTAARDFVDAVLSGKNPSIYLYSERPGEALAPGSGKTHLAVAILRELALDIRVPLGDLRFMFVPRLLLEIQRTFKSAERSELEIVEEYARADILVWDDFGAEKLSDYSGRTIYTLLYEREGKSNIFTSNLSLDAVEARDPSGYTQRITSRIAGDSRIIQMTGPDRRLAA